MSLCSSELMFRTTGKRPSSKQGRRCSAYRLHVIAYDVKEAAVESYRYKGKAACGRFYLHASTSTYKPPKDQDKVLLCLEYMVLSY
ncbi:hypothetical protein V6N13_043231 [Hibiscus sabdariffa]|uniref:Uncharacterized protein n=1 Tax=Hibiscus sabdariffa TaxID=183260 RepID=A0ABR2G2F8_9ROSI